MICKLIGMTFNYTCIVIFYIQAKDGIRDLTVTGVQTCALPICPRDALFSGDGPHVTRLRCRVIGRDDQGDLRCAPGKPTLDYNATKVLRSFARKCTLDRLRVPPRHRPADDELSFVGLTAFLFTQ